MNRKALYFLTVLLALTVSAVAVASSRQPRQAEAGNVQLPLQEPSLSNSLLDTSLQSVLDSEAGISAYTQISPFSLSAIRDLYRTIEIETDDYLLGSIGVPNNWEQWDVHVYAHRSGWLLAYYLRDDPTVNIFDAQNYTGSPLNPTRFQAVLNVITLTLGRPDSDLTYYDFRYPNATNLLLAVEDTTDYQLHEGFDILDTTYVYYERSWMLGGTTGGIYGGAWVSYYLDGVEVHRFSGDNKTFYDTGFLSATQLPPDESHQVMIYHYCDDIRLVMGALAIVYGP